MRLGGTPPMHRGRAPIAQIRNRKRLRLGGMLPFLREHAPLTPAPRLVHTCVVVGSCSILFSTTLV